MSNLKTELPGHESALSFLMAFWNLFGLVASYRSSMRIKEAMILGDGYIYFCCPRCSVTLNREYLSFCDRCGQKLDWTKCRQAKIKKPSSV